MGGKQTRRHYPQNGIQTLYNSVDHLKPNKTTTENTTANVKNLSCFMDDKQLKLNKKTNKNLIPSYIPPPFLFRIASNIWIMNYAWSQSIRTLLNHEIVNSI